MAFQIWVGVKWNRSSTCLEISQSMNCGYTNLEKITDIMQEALGFGEIAVKFS